MYLPVPGVIAGGLEPRIDAHQSAAPPSTAAPGHADQGGSHLQRHAPRPRAVGSQGALPSPQLAAAAPFTTQPGSAGQGLAYPSVNAPAPHPVGPEPVVPTAFTANSFLNLVSCFTCSACNFGFVEAVATRAHNVSTSAA